MSQDHTPHSMQAEAISSPSNPLIKLLKTLDRKKGRAETGLFLAEGARLVEQGLQQGWHAAHVLVSQSALERPYVRRIMDMASGSNARIAIVPERLISAVTKKDNPQTVLAAFEQRHTGLEALPSDVDGIWIALYEVRDPGNLGTIIRTADCAGVAGVILLETCCDLYSIETVRATMGSIFDLPVAAASFDAFNAWRRTRAISLTAASVNGTVRHDQVDYGRRACIIMGNEQSGLPGDVERTCDTLAIIPMRGGADSLNLAQATAIMTYEAWRQRGFEGART